MPMMKILSMRMTMNYRPMLMSVSMWPVGQRIVNVVMMAIVVTVFVFMFQLAMSVLVLVALGEMEIDADHHQRDGCNCQDAAKRFAEGARNHSPDEGRGGKDGPSSG